MKKSILIGALRHYIFWIHLFIWLLRFTKMGLYFFKEKEEWLFKSCFQIILLELIDKVMWMCRKSDSHEFFSSFDKNCFNNTPRQPIYSGYNWQLPSRSKHFNKTGGYWISGFLFIWGKKLPQHRPTLTLHLKLEITKDYNIHETKINYPKKIKLPPP